MTNSVTLGNLTFLPVKENLELLAKPVIATLELENNKDLLDKIYVSEIDPGFADTAQFCEFYDVGLDISANTIVVEAKRADRRWYAMCNVLATTRADVNKTIRKYLDAKSASFASMDFAVNETGMEYGGIGIIGGPSDWPVLIDSRVLDHDYVIIGSGIRASKIAISPKILAQITNATVIENMAIEV